MIAPIGNQYLMAAHSDRFKFTQRFVITMSPQTKRKATRTRPSKFEKFIDKKHQIIEKLNYGHLLILLTVFFIPLGISPRQIKQFFQLCFGQRVSRHTIQRIIEEAGSHAQKILDPMDKQAASLIEVLEVDTTWKGKGLKVFGAIAKESRYLFALDPVKAESLEALSPCFAHLSERLVNLKAIISDMAVTFETLSRQYLPWAHHLICHVHVMRTLNKEFRAIRKTFKGLWKPFADLKSQLATAKGWLLKNRIHRRQARQNRRRLNKRRNFQATTLGIPLNTNGTLISRRLGWPPCLKSLCDKIYKWDATIIRYHTQIQRQQQKLTRVRAEVQQVTIEKNRKLGPLLTVFRLKARVFNYLRWSNPVTEATEYQKILHLAQQSQEPFAIQTVTMLTTHANLRTPLDLFQAEILTPRQQSTNTLEGYYSKSRVSLDSWRNCQLTSQLKARLTLLRFYQNFYCRNQIGITPIRALNLQFVPSAPFQLLISKIEPSFL